MQRPITTNRFKRGVALLLAALIMAPLGFLTETVVAKPPSHAPAWGYRDNDKDDNGRRRRVRRHYKRGHYDSNGRHYRLRYRTRRDKKGRVYRQWYRDYD